MAALAVVSRARARLRALLAAAPARSRARLAMLRAPVLFRTRARLAALLAAALIAGLAAGCGGDDSGSGDVPSSAVATVGEAEISEGELDEQVEALARAQRGGGSGGAKDGSSGEVSDAVRKQLEAQALTTLLMREALEQEAADRGIEVGDDEVRERWDAASGQQFKTAKALRRFLGGQTEAELLAQLRLQLLAERIGEQVAEEAGGGKQGRQAVARFQREFQRRWQERTACRDGYAAAGCGDG